MHPAGVVRIAGRAAVVVAKRHYWTPSIAAAATTAADATARVVVRVSVAAEAVAPEARHSPAGRAIVGRDRFESACCRGPHPGVVLVLGKGREKGEKKRRATRKSIHEA